MLCLRVAGLPYVARYTLEKPFAVDVRRLTPLSRRSYNRGNQWDKVEGSGVVWRDLEQLCSREPTSIRWMTSVV